MDRSIGAFIDHARQKGMDHGTIRMLLLSAGWKEKEIARAMTEQALDIPIPTPPDVGGAREAFLHLVTFAALYTAVTAGVGLAFDFINTILPDPAMTQYAIQRAEWIQSKIRWEISAVIVSFPILVWMSWVNLREMRATPDKARSAVRRWLTYVTLFFAAVALATDVITLVSTLLGGEMSLRFVLKVLVVLLVAGACLAYYFAALRMTPEESQATPLHRNAALAASAAVLITVGAGVFATGLPSSVRQRQVDLRRIEDIRMIYGEVMDQTAGSFWRTPDVKTGINNPLPSTLEQVAANAARQRPRIQDPVTSSPYGYQVVTPSTFRVCATFDTARNEARDVAWNHPAGWHCFTFDVLKPVH